MTATEALQVAARYRRDLGSLTEKEKAVRERAIWAMAKDSNKGVEKWGFLKTLTGQEVYAMRNRGDILTAGDAAEPLWLRIHNKEMLPKTGREIVVQARKMSLNEDKDMALAIIDCLNKYDALPYIRVTDGVPYRIGSVKGKKKEPEVTKFPTFEVGKDRLFWPGLKTAISGYFEKKCEEMDPSTREGLRRELETDLKILVDQFLNRIHSAQKREKYHTAVATVAITRNKVLDACEALHMDPPLVGGPVDLDKARRQKKLLARAYHPDSNGGDETTQGSYINVIQAYQTLEAFARQSNSTHRDEDNP